MRKIIVSLLLIIFLVACTPEVKPAPTATLTAAPTATLATGLPPQATVTPGPAETKQQAEIKNVIAAYFEIRYRALSVSPPEDFQQNGFGAWVSDGPDAKDFLAAEMAKLAVERKHLTLQQYLYVKYDYTLNYKEIRIDTSNPTARVSLIEYFEIICEKAVASNPLEPHACAIGSFNHEISLRNEQGRWKIVSDLYLDSWWRQFRTPGASQDEILRNINSEMLKLSAKSSP